MRTALGDGYVKALRAACPDIPESSDLVMYWWHRAATLVREGQVSRFGLITTNSLRQAFGRRVVEYHMLQQPPLKLLFAIPDHPWVDTADGAAVRIAMTVGGVTSATGVGRLATVRGERGEPEGTIDVDLAEQQGPIGPDLAITTTTAQVRPLRSNSLLSNRGMIPHGDGFLVTPSEGSRLDGGALLRPYRNGKDLADRPRGVLAIDTYGLSEAELRKRFPQTWQWLRDRVKPVRDQNPRKGRREGWWLFGENQPRLRASVAGLSRYIATGQTAKHRIFQFLTSTLLPDDKLIVIALDDAFALGVLSSRVHGVWALAVGARLEDRPVYNKTTCFEAFPFPSASAQQKERIGSLAEEIDAHRKRQQELHPTLTLTAIYNALEAFRSGLPLSKKDQNAYTDGVVALLAQLHDDLDSAVMAAYGWPATMTEDEILQRLVSLNVERVEEERQESVRWLRPEFQLSEQGSAQRDVEPERRPGIASTRPPKGPSVAPARPRARADRRSTRRK